MGDRLTDGLGGKHTRKVQISHAKLRAFDVYREVHLASSRQVLDVAVAAVLGAAGDGAGALLADLLLDVGVGGASVHILRLRRLRDYAAAAVHGLDELALAPVPLGQHVGRRRAAEDARVDEASEADAGDVT